MSMQPHLYSMTSYQLQSARQPHRPAQRVFKIVSACVTVTTPNKQSNPNDGQNRLTLTRRILNGDAYDLPVVDDEGRTLVPGATEDGLGIEHEAEAGAEGAGVVGG